MLFYEFTSTIFFFFKHNLRSFIFSGMSESRFDCPHKCGKTYRYYRGICEHLKFGCGVKPKFKCFVCHQRFARKYSMKRHIITIHGQNPG